MITDVVNYFKAIIVSTVLIKCVHIFDTVFMLVSLMLIEFIFSREFPVTEFTSKFDSCVTYLVSTEMVRASISLLALITSVDLLLFSASFHLGHYFIQTCVFANMILGLRLCVFIVQKFEMLLQLLLIFEGKSTFIAFVRMPWVKMTFNVPFEIIPCFKTISTDVTLFASTFDCRTY